MINIPWFKSQTSWGTQKTKQFQFTPKDDITARELLELMIHCNWPYILESHSGRMYVTEKQLEDFEKNMVRRHFTEHV